MVISNLNNLLPLKKEQIKAASVACAQAFKDDPWVSYIIPDEDKRENKMRYMLEFYLRLNLMLGEVYTVSPRLEGIAGWLPSDRKIGLINLLRSGFHIYSVKCGLRAFLRDGRVDRFCERIRKKYAPDKHFYLALLAIDPKFQGRGYGGALLKPMLERLDEQKLPCWLDTSGEKNVSFYRHFGFKIMHQAEYPGSQLVITAMQRDPR
jgi:ribosomal protein S18 acetylase RimI-like enzyme